MYRVYHSVTNTTGIINIKFQESHQDTAPMLIVEAESTTLNNGDAVICSLGYVGDYNQIFSGYVKEVTKSTPPTKYKISAYGYLVRASDYFIASTNPDNPYTNSNVTAEALVGEVLALAGITSYGYEATSFTFTEVEVNLASAYEYCHGIANTLAWYLYADQNNKAWFIERWNGLMAGDTATKTVDNTKMIDAQRTESTRDLRNRIVVYGKNGISAESKATSAHLPSGFYQTVVASADWMDSQAQANLAASRNLALLNKLGETCRVSIFGDSSYAARQIVTFNYSTIGASGDWYVESIDHNMSSTGGFTTVLSLKK